MSARWAGNESVGVSWCFASRVATEKGYGPQQEQWAE